MDKEKIAQQEAANDGQTINLYYDEMVGVYLAFGLSAYYATMAGVRTSRSRMPCRCRWHC